MSLEGLEDWLGRARPGDWLIYQRGPFMVHDEVTRRVGELARAGLVHPWQPRSPSHPGCRDFKIQKGAAGASAPAAGRGIGGAPAGGSSPGAAGAADPASRIILAALRRAANFGRRCPSDTELARAAGLPTKAKAAWRVARLEQAGAIRRQTIEEGPEAGWRVVTIVATGRHTQAPPSWAELRRAVAPDLAADDAEGGR